MSPPDTPVLGALRALTALHERLERLSPEELAILAQVVQERFGIRDWTTATADEVQRNVDVNAILAVYLRHREKRAKRASR